MEWLERWLGGAEYRCYGEHEYYEYPRHDGGFASDGDGEFERELEAGGNEWAWRGPSIFEDPNANMYSRRICDTSRYVSQYGGTTEFYNPPNGKCGEFANGHKELLPRHGTLYMMEDYNARSDHVLARDVQRPLSLNQYPVSYGATAKKSVGMSACAGCGGSLGFGRFLTCGDENWHPSCFSCKACHKIIVDKYSLHRNDPYHRDCYKELFHPKCEICFNHIPLNSRGQIEYSSHPFWNQKHCPSHERDGSTCCCICNRIEAVDQLYQSLGDGRKACSECMETAMMTTQKCQPLYQEVLSFYNTTLGMPIEQNIPMMLVEREALNHACIADTDSHNHAQETRGLCLSEERVFQGLEHGSETESRGIPRRHCEVTAILVLYGLPRLLTGSVLAHELMHAWIRLDGRFCDLENDVEEGICQVIAHMWLKSELHGMRASAQRGYNYGGGGGGSLSAANQRLGEFFLHQIESDASPIYGADSGWPLHQSPSTAFPELSTI